MPHKDKEERKEYSRNYFLKHKEQINEYNRKRREENPDKFKEYGKKQRELHPDAFKQYREKNKEKIQASQKNYREKNRDLVISKYGKICGCCGEHIKEFLAIDHIDGVKIEGWPTHGGSLYRKLIKENYPEGFRVLCHNCNLSLGIYGYCPHKTEIRNEIDKKRTIVLKYYGNKCECCGESNIEFLAVDHKKGDGADEKRRGIEGHRLIGHIIKNNFPNKYRILCHNCNTSCGVNGVCAHEKWRV